MKKIVLSFALFAALSVSSFAQDQSSSRERIAPYVKELNLTDKQRTQMDALRDEYKEKRNALNVQFKEDMKRILTPEQVTKLEAMEKNRPTNARKKGPRDQYDKGGDYKKGNYRGKGKIDTRNLDEASQQKLEDLRNDYNQKKASIEKSKLAPDTQREELKALRQQYTNDVQNVLNYSTRSNTTMERPHSVQAFMDISPDNK